MTSVIHKQGYNRKEAATYIGMAENTFMKLLNSGEVNFIRVGRRVIIPKKSLDAWLEKAGTSKGGSNNE
jgi:excisionase family DNA binding protein